MRAGYDCPHCSFGIDPGVWGTCPRCRKTLPQRSVDLTVPAYKVPGEDPVQHFYDDLTRPKELPEPDVSEPPNLDDQPSHWQLWRSWRLRIVGFLTVGTLLVLLWGIVDLDKDGMNSFGELRADTSPFIGDTDGDGLADGWELQHGIDALNRDMDGDLQPDDVELAAGSDPRNWDSDGDGLGDQQEAGGQDCDGDGHAAASDSDDDNDLIRDVAEAPALRCKADSDSDGLVDGNEQAEPCMVTPDCDQDGLPDAEEHGTAYSMLDADTFDVGLPDSIPWAFEASGQGASEDGDEDGIPDGWESDDGLIQWGSLQPAPGRRDLLIEYVRVEGPDSRRFGGLDFTPAYEDVAAFFEADGGMHVTWVETVVELETEERPPLLPDAASDYYAGVLAGARHTSNPYVTSVVLNPQHDQSRTLHGGVANIRGMLATVDYGAHVVFTFEDEDGNELRALPIWESIAFGSTGSHDGENVQELGFDLGGLTEDGEVAYRSNDDDYWLTWRPNWFRTAPTFTFDDGTEVRLHREDVEVLDRILASTIAHELGHTLGLCHAHEAECYNEFPAADRRQRDASSMSYNAPADTLHFLGTEWETVTTYVGCPPQGPLALVAGSGTAQEIRDAKYVTGVDEQTRMCGDFIEITQSVEPDPNETLYKPTASEAEPVAGKRTPVATLAYLLGSVVVALVCAELFRRLYEHLVRTSSSL